MNETIVTLGLYVLAFMLACGAWYVMKSYDQIVAMRKALTNLLQMIESNQRQEKAVLEECAASLHSIDKTMDRVRPPKLEGRPYDM